MTNGRIAVIISEIFDPLDYELLNGIYSQAEKLNYDTVVLTGIRDIRLAAYHKMFSEKLDNIYTLINSAHFDGIIFVAESFYESHTEQHIFSLIEKTNIPCVTIGRKYKNFRSVFPNQRFIMRKITGHLIKEHHCRKFGFLSGIKGEYNSEERFAGFKSALDSAGIAFDENNLFYGEFWKYKPKEIGLKIAEKKELDAVVCASDLMAVSLCEGLVSGGAKIPQDIKITGYDGECCAVLNTPNITTATGCKFDEGTLAVNELYNIIKGENFKTPETYKILFGTSCGCKSDVTYSDSWAKRELLNIINHHMDSGRYLTDDMTEKISRANSFDELIEIIGNLADFLHDWYGLDICLCTDWKFNFENHNSFRSDGFSDEMHLIMDKRRYVPDGKRETFPTKNLLPTLEREHSPLLITMSALNIGSQVLGYIAFLYDRPDLINYDARFMNWNSAVANGFSLIQQKLYDEYKSRQNIVMSVIDPITGYYNQRGFLERLSERKDDKLIVWYFGIYEERISNIENNYFQIISTSLRLSSDPSEDISVIGKNLFAIILTADGDNPDNVSFRRMLRFMQEAEKIQGFDRYSKFPDILSKSILIDGRDKNKLRKTAELAESSKLCLSSGECDKLKSDLLWLRINIKLHPESDLTIDDMAKYLNISRTYLQRIYKNLFGISAKEDVIISRIEKAKYLLSFTSSSIAEISEQCGYSDANHFMRQFRERIGFTALEYRKKNAYK
ncbi:MAG: helix-turn-helix domain-containing protein [Ruminococcus sp.]|nr:helix-turn-helix domain-containing protein [Ruminococcus sp.]